MFVLFPLRNKVGESPTGMGGAVAAEVVKDFALARFNGVRGVRVAVLVLGSGATR